MAIYGKKKKRTTTPTTNPATAGGNITLNVAGGSGAAGTLDASTIPILGGGGDPLGLSSLLPKVGPGNAPLTVKARLDSVAGITGAKRDQLGALLAGALGEKPKTNYTVSEVQSLLSTAFNHTQQAGAKDLSDYLTQSIQQNPQGTSSSAPKITIPTPTETQNVYSTADITATANAAAQKLVGRNATAAEIQAITDTVNANEASNTQAKVSGSEASTASADAASNSGGQVDTFLAAIRQHESGGNYTANSGDGAYGAYQYTPNTWNSEAKQAGYGQYANGRADQAPPQVQDAVARYDAANKFNSLGSWKNVAEAWYYPAWAGDPAHQNDVPMPGAGNTETIGAYGDQIVQMMGEASATPASTAASPGSSRSPVGAGLKQGRTDQGVDFTGSGPLYAVDSGKILSVSNSGWPGGAFIALKLDHPIDPQHSVVYYAENISASVKVGQTVKAGQQIGTATGASNPRGSGIEIGWADPNAIGSALAHGAGGEGAVTAQGQSFLDYISGGASSGQQLSEAVKAGGGAYLTALDQQSKAMQNAVDMSGGANNTTIVDQSVNDPSSVAESYYMNQHSTEFQSNNLLGVFSTISASLKAGGNQAAGLRGTPIDMRAAT